MKTKILFSLCLFLFSFLVAQNQKYLVGLGDTFITISNNYFVAKDEYKVVKAPWKDQIVDVYGEKLKIEASHNIAESESYSYVKGDIQKLPQYQFDNLEFSISKNGGAISDWNKITDSPTLRKIESYSLFIGDLLDGDELKLSFRGANGKVFLNYTFKKKSEDIIPFSIGDFHSYNPISLESFLEASMNAQKSFKSDFYRDWPSSYHTQSNAIVEKVDENTRFAIFFRQKKDGDSKNMIEYRVLENNSPLHKGWNTADDFIILDDFKSGKKYTLQARYKGQTKFFEKKFISQPSWYQNVWVKVGSVALLLLLIALVYNYFRNIKAKRLQREQSTKLQLLSAQLNPHFVFNALNSIQGLVNSNDNLNANLYLNEFAKLMRNIVDFGQHTTIPLFEDVKALKHYLTLEKLRFLFHFEINLEENLSGNSVDVLPFLVQPIIENSVKHGVSMLKENGLIVVKIFRSRSDLIYEIHDNGYGFDVEDVKKRKGLKLVEERINLFNLGSKSKNIELNMKSSNLGTIVTLTYKDIL